MNNEEPVVKPVPTEQERRNVPRFEDEDSDDYTTRKFIYSMMNNHLPHIYSRMGTIEGKLTLIMAASLAVFGGMVSLVIKTIFDVANK